MFLAGLLYTSVGMALSYFVFREIAGILMVFLIVLATVPLLYTTIVHEEELELKNPPEIFLLKEHSKVLLFLIFLFLGITASFVAAYILLPQDVSHNLFELQEQAIVNVNTYVQGSITGGAALTAIFSKICWLYLPAVW